MTIIHLKLISLLIMEAMVIHKIKYLLIFFLLFNPFTFTKAAVSGKTLFDLENLCRNSHYESCGHLGVYYRDEVKDPKRAIPFYEKACLGGRSGSCMHLAALYSNLIPDVEKRLRYSQKACTIGEPIGCAMAGLTIAHDFKDEESAAKYFKLACDKNNDMGCDSLGDYYSEKSEHSADYLPLASKTYQKACNLKLKESCAKLSQLRERIKKQNECNAKESSLQKKCVLHDCSEDILSFIMQGCAIFKTEQIIIPLFEKNCIKFKSTACHEVAALHLFKNRFKEAAKYSAFSCEKGNHYSCSINKFSNVMQIGKRRDIINITKEFANNCYNKNLVGDCLLANVLLHNNKIDAEIDVKNLAVKGCSLNESGLCLKQAEFTVQTDEKIKILTKACELKNQLGCLEAGKLLKDGTLFEKLKALKFFRLSCSGHELDNPIEYGCGDLVILESQFQNLIPSSNAVKIIIMTAIATCVLLYGVLRFRRRVKALRSLEEKTIALEGEFNKKRKEDILNALDRIE